MTPEVRKQIEEGVKELAKKSTAPDKETPDWMETDIRRGAEFGYSLASKALSDAKDRIGVLMDEVSHAHIKLADANKEIENWENQNRELAAELNRTLSGAIEDQIKISNLKAEVERLKGLIDRLLKNNYTPEYAAIIKTENNL